MKVYLARISEWERDEWGKVFMSSHVDSTTTHIVGVFSTVKRAEEALSNLIPELKWHECANQEDTHYSEWIDDQKQYFFESQHGSKHFADFICVEGLELDEVDEFYRTTVIVTP